jgi:signal transduction histidine kinase
MGLRHRSIRLRVGILIVVPVLCLIGLYGFAASITLGTALNQAHARVLSNDLTAPVSNFQGALAQERHLALLSLASPNSTQFASELGMQENNTRKALDALTAAIQSAAVADNAYSGEQQAIRNLQRAEATLPALRSNVAAGAISTSAALAGYNAIINALYTVLDESLGGQTDVSIVTQATHIVAMSRGLQAMLAESDLLAADMTQGRFPDSDRLLFAQLAALRQQLTGSTTAELQPGYRALIDKAVSPAMASALTAAESQVIQTSWHKGPPPPMLVASTGAFGPYARAMAAALLLAGSKLQTQTSHQANVVFIELLLAAGLGLLGTIASIALSLVIGRGLVRQLHELRESALGLAHERLPSVINRLRAGEQVDATEYAPAGTPGRDEIQQVQHAFSVVQQTAVQTAIDEARLRRGISDVFRNLAGRSQSLLHRQLTLLDGMERRATEPDELEDLFRIDHLTTRMRRHAEGLIILSGETPARGWRQPVPLVDVLRAAVAEVEDYTRIRVLCRTNAAVAGHAVADVIHLIAELAENATVFSPPSTPVRIQGDIVGRGFAVEIEDRGLGISQTRMDEINANLANPPQFDLSGSDRLGLFIAGQLAQRHNIKITLRSSVYGGTTAIVLIPIGLVVEADSYERDPALPAGQGTGSALPNRFAGRHAALTQADSGLPGSPNGGNGYAITQAGIEPDTDASRPWLPVGADAPAASAGSVAAIEPDPVRLTWSGESAGTTETVGTGEREPVKLSWSDGSYSKTERESVRLGWSDDGSSGQHESATGWPSAPFGEPDGSVTKTQVSELGLPVRIRQANLAPQLRRSTPPPAVDTSLGSGFYSGATTASGTPQRRPGDSDIDPFAPRRSASQERATSDSGSHLASPEAARSTMSALQRGWQLGRSEAEQRADPAEPSDGSAPGGSSPSGNSPGGSSPGGYSPSGQPPTADSAQQHENE